jgi:hypothetical protein
VNSIIVALLVGTPGFLGAWTIQCSAHQSPRPTKSVDTHYVAVDGDDNGPGTFVRPWATVNYAAEQTKAGEKVVVRGGRYRLTSQIRPSNSGRQDAWITFMAYRNEKPVLDAAQIPYASMRQAGLDNGTFQLQNVAFIRVIGLSVVNSHDAGFTVRDSSSIDLINNATNNTFSSGIAVWDTKHDGVATKHVRIIGNSITRATTWDQAPPDLPHRGEPPHEALSVGGAVDFEVAHNHIYDSDKEGIDIKETSRRGKIHHNFIETVDRQGLYIDAWFGKITNIEVFSNLVEHCRGAGIAVSVENGQKVEDIDIHNNLIVSNDGSGLYFSRWGVNGPREKITIRNNTFYHNGYAAPKDGQEYYWMTGGLYLYSTSVHDISIVDNIFSDNRGFQIGYSNLYLKDYKSWTDAAHTQNIIIRGNLIDGQNMVTTPIESGGDIKDQVKIFAVNGQSSILSSPMFKDPDEQNFTLRRNSRAARASVGAYAPDSKFEPWWKHGTSSETNH